jgi:hypothetical protein
VASSVSLLTGLAVLQRLLDADAAADMLARENSGFSVDASVRITLLRPHLRVSCQPLEHLLRYCARPPFDRATGRLLGVSAAAPALDVQDVQEGR